MLSLCKKLCIPLLSIFILSCLFVPDTTPLSLAESDVEQSAASHLYDAYTDDDSFTWESETYTIQEYSASLKNQMDGATLDPDLPDLFGSTAEYGFRLYGTDSQVYLTASGNDPIVEIIPEELFTAEGQTLYIGREYGFYIQTERRNSDSDILYSTVLVFDIVNETNLDETSDRLIFNVKVLFEITYIYLPVGTEAFLTAQTSADGDFSLIPECNKIIYIQGPLPQDCIVPLKYYYYVEGYGQIHYKEDTRFSLQDISFSGVLANEQGLNEGDIGYDVDEDEGPFFIRMDYFFDGIKSLKSTGLGDEEIAQIVFSCMNFVLGLIPDLGTMMSIIETGVEIGTIVTSALDTKEFDVNNQNAIYDCYRTTGPKQIEDYGELMRGADANIDSNGEEYFQFLAGDWAEAQFTVGDSSHDAAGSPGRIYRRIELKVRDRCADTVMATSVSQYGFGFNEDGAEDLSLAEPALMALLPEDGINRFDFTPDYGGVYEWLPEGVDLSALTCTVDGVPVTPLNGKFLSQLTADHTYRIEIASDSAERQTGTFQVRPTTDLTEITLPAGTSTLVTLPYSETRPVNLTASNPQITFSSRYAFENGQLIGTSLMDQPGAGFIQKAETYLLIKNNSDQTQTTDLLLNAAGDLSEGDNFLNYTYYSIFYRFTAELPALYRFKALPACMCTFYDAQLNPLSVTTSSNADGSNSWTLTVNEPETVFYIQIQSSSHFSGTLTIEQDLSGFAWIINNVAYQNIQEISLKRGDSYQIQFQINGEVLAEGFNVLNTDPYSVYIETSFQNLSLNLLSDCALKGDGIYLIPKFSAPYSIYLNIIPEFENEVDLTFFNDPSGLGFTVNAQEELQSLTITYGTGNVSKAVTYSLPNNHLEGVFIFDILGDIDTWAPIGSNVSAVISQIDVSTRDGVTPYIFPISLNGSLSFNSHFGGGDGKSEQTPFLIGCTRHLLNIQRLTHRDENINIDVITGYFRLTNDCNLTNEIWTPLYFYKGHLDGDDHLISNLTIEFDRGGYYGLFSYLAASSVKNLRLTAFISGEVQNTSFVGAGGISGFSTSPITNCSVFCNFDIGAEISAVGGIVGLNYSSISDCTTSVSVSGTETHSSLTSIDVGGIAGKSLGTITNCTNNSNVSCTDGAAGGICGDNQGTITDCTNYGQIDLTVTRTISDYSACGGIAGTNSGIISNCTNNKIVHSFVEGQGNEFTVCGGIVGVNLTKSINSCTNNSIVSSINGTVGGIAGANKATITGCTNKGNIQLSVLTENNDYTLNGGIVGRNWDGTVQSCINQGKVGFYGSNLNDSRSLQPSMGQIAGRNTDGTISSNQCNGTLYLGPLKVVTWQILFWTQSHDQTARCQEVVGWEG